MTYRIILELASWREPEDYTGQYKRCLCLFVETDAELVMGCKSDGEETQRWFVGGVCS